MKDFVTPPFTFKTCFTPLRYPQPFDHAASNVLFTLFIPKRKQGIFFLKNTCLWTELLLLTCTLLSKTEFILQRGLAERSQKSNIARCYPCGNRFRLTCHIIREVLQCYKIGTRLEKINKIGFYLTKRTACFVLLHIYMI